jgi:hypothetical protein
MEWHTEAYTWHPPWIEQFHTCLLTLWTKMNPCTFQWKVNCQRHHHQHCILYIPVIPPPFPQESFVSWQYSSVTIVHFMHFSTSWLDSPRPSVSVGHIT